MCLYLFYYFKCNASANTIVFNGEKEKYIFAIKDAFRNCFDYKIGCSGGRYISVQLFKLKNISIYFISDCHKIYEL